MKSSSPMRAGRISAAAESPGSTPHHRQKPPRVPKENVDPGPDNVPTLHRSPSGGKPLSAKNRSPLPPRPPPPNPLKRKLYLDAAPTSDSAGSPIPSPADSGVQVILRIRPPNKEEEDEEDLIVQKISPEAVSILDHTFTFDSVTDAGSTQQDIFRLVGLPLVENCLAGFNSSIFAYGQTGSGKTYTMWGPTNVLSEDYLAKEERGLTPRVFEQLFARIKEEQIKHSGVQLSYQCRCSFLEIYNEQITDLLDLNQRNLQIREDTQTGVYVESLTEEYVSSTKDITKLLIKGLENRRTGATSLNIESSRSHCVFTCIVESRAKSMTDGLSSVRTSRINLVDLAGSERQKQTGAAGERLKEAGNINRSLSQLGNLINILAEISKSGKQRHIPYRDSRLTFLLQESLGGNAKLAMICAVSPSKSCKSETLSTLRFAKRAKSIKNKAVVNEVTHDDVNVLREQIRQLKDELLRMRSNGNSTGKTGSFSTGWNARRSLNIMRQSLCNVVDMEIDEEDAEKRPVQDSDKSAKAGPELDSSEETSSISSESRNSHQNLLPNSESTALIHSDQASNIESNMEVCEPEAVVIEEPGNCNRFDQEKVESELHCTEQPNSNRFSQEKAESELDITKLIDAHETIPPLSDGSLLLKALEELSNTTKRKSSSSTQSCGSIVPFQKSPAPEASPLKSSVGRKIPKTSSSMSTSRDARLVAKPSSSLVNKSSALDPGSKKTPNTPIMRKTVSSLEPTEHLALSLRRGLEVFELHQKKSPLGRSSFRFPLKPVEIINPSLAVVKVDCAVQTISQELDLSAESSAYVCRYCKSNIPALDDCKDVNADNELQLVPVDTPLQTERPIKQVPKAVEKVLAGAIRREMALEDTCARQAAEIAHLHRLAQQYKHERECNVIIEQTREDKICRLEGLMDGIIPAEHYMEEEFMSLANEHKILREKYENHPDILRMNVELRAVQDELDRYRNFFDLGERDVLMEEIQDLRCQLQYYIDCSSSSQIQKRNLLLQLTRAHDSVKVLPNETSEHTEECSDKNFDDERQRWTETESRWISLSEELRQELETARSLTEKQKLELDSERKCSEELKEALQTAIQNHARMLEQYAELEEKHIQLLARHRKIRDGIVDVKKAAVRAGVKGSESRFIDCLGAEISTLKAEREKERRYWRDENKALRSQLNDTAEAVQAAGELLVRLKEAEEAAAMAQGRTEMAEKEVERALREITSLKQKHETEVFKLNQLLEESSRFPKEEALALSPHSEAGVAKYDDDGGETLTDEQWKSEFEPFCHEDRDFSRGAEDHSWFSDYDRCNI